MPHGVVHLLESVDIQEQKSDVTVRLLGDGNDLIYPCVERAAIGKSGERVMVGEEKNVLFCHFEVGDVEDEPVQARDDAGLPVFDPLNGAVVQ